MKQLLTAILLFSAGYAATAQELAPDQNPNYKTSVEKYKAMQENLQTTMNSTVQSTYAAYDWSTAKEAKKTERRNDRRERRLYDNYYRDNNYYGYDNNYNKPYRYRRYNGRW